MAKKPKKSLQKGASPIQEVDVGRGRVSNTVERLKGVTAGKQKRNAVIVLSIIMAAVLILPPTIMYLLGGSPFKPQIDEEELDNYIGFYTISVLTYDSEGEEQTDATIKLFDYDTEEELGEVLADGETVYETDVITLAMVYYVHDGKAYPNASFVIMANKSQSTPRQNNIFLNEIGSVSDFDATIIETESDGTYGTTLAEITIENFTMNMRFRNNGGGEYGYHYYVPEPYRTNDLCALGALWLKVDAVVNYLELGLTQPEMVVVDLNYTYVIDDVNGDTYIILPTLYSNDVYDYWFYMECDTIPTVLEAIQGQWDGVVLETVS